MGLGGNVQTQWLEGHLAWYSLLTLPSIEAALALSAGHSECWPVGDIEKALLYFFPH